MQNDKCWQGTDSPRPGPRGLQDPQDLRGPRAALPLEDRVRCLRGRTVQCPHRFNRLIEAVNRVAMHLQKSKESPLMIPLQGLAAVIRCLGLPLAHGHLPVTENRLPLLSTYINHQLLPHYPLVHRSNHRRAHLNAMLQTQKRLPLYQTQGARINLLLFPQA